MAQNRGIPGGLGFLACESVPANERGCALNLAADLTCAVCLNCTDHGSRGDLRHIMSPGVSAGLDRTKTVARQRLAAGHDKPELSSGSSGLPPGKPLSITFSRPPAGRRGLGHDALSLGRVVLFARSDRSYSRRSTAPSFWPRFMFASSDRTWPPCSSKPLTWANGQPLVAADGPQLMTAVTSRACRGRPPSPGCGPKWQTFAVTFHERNQTGMAGGNTLFQRLVLVLGCRAGSLPALGRLSRRWHPTRWRYGGRNHPRSMLRTQA